MLKLLSALRPLAVLLLSLVAARSAGAESIESRAGRVSQAFLAGWLARHPEEGTRLGDHAHDGALPLLARAAMARDAAWYEGQRDSLATLPLENLAPASRIDVKLARSRAALEARAIRDERLPERDPGFALAPLELALETPIRGFYSSPCSRASALRSRLRAVPEYLRDARLALTAPSRACVEAGLDRVAGLIALCRESVPRSFGDCRESRIQAELAEADSLATRALVEYERFLRDDVLPLAVDEIPFGRAALEAHLAGVAGEAVSLDSLLARAREEMVMIHAPLPLEEGVLRSEADRHAPREIAPDSARVLLEKVHEAVARAREFALGDDARLDFGASPLQRTTPRLTAIGPWDSRKTRARLDLGTRPGSGGGWAFNPPSVPGVAEMTIAAEGIPGRALLVIRTAAIGSRVRQALGSEAVADGWARYAEAVWIATMAENHRLVGLHRYRERERLARSVAELMLRVEGASIDSTAAWLASAANLTPDDAKRATLEAAAAPRWTASTLG